MNNVVFLGYKYGSIQRGLFVGERVYNLYLLFMWDYYGCVINEFLLKEMKCLW